MLRSLTAATVATLLLSACAPSGAGDPPGEDTDRAGGNEDAATEIALGPVDGHDLPPTDLDRVQVGDLAPDFTLASLAGPPVTLSDFRGVKDVVLVFYRGHW